MRELWQQTRRRRLANDAQRVSAHAVGGHTTTSGCCCVALLLPHPQGMQSDTAGTTSVVPQVPFLRLPAETTKATPSGRGTSPLSQAVQPTPGFNFPLAQLKSKSLRRTARWGSQRAGGEVVATKDGGSGLGLAPPQQQLGCSAPTRHDRAWKLLLRTRCKSQTWRRQHGTWCFPWGSLRSLPRACTCWGSPAPAAGRQRARTARPRRQAVPLSRTSQS